MTKRKTKRGGRRAGAGRPPKDNRKIAVTKKLDPIVVEFLKSQPNATTTIETAIAALPEFEQFRQASRS